MNEQKLDELLPCALREAARQELSDSAMLPCPQSAQRSRAKMLDDPEKWRKNLLRPVWQKVLRAAACLALTCALSLAVLYDVSPTAYAELSGWFMEIGEDSVIFRFAGDSDAPLPEYALGSLPEGAELLKRSEEHGWVSYLYLWRENYLKFEYTNEQNRSVMGLQAKAEERVEINGCSGWFYPAKDETRNAAVTWVDEENGIFFYLDCRANKEEILHIAESVILSEMPN